MLASSDAASVVSTHLIPGERLLWAGRPKQGLAFRGWDILTWPLSVLMCVVGTFLIVDEWRKPDEPGVLIFVIVMTLAAFYMAFGRFFIDRWQRSMTYYAVTDRRAIILTRESPDYIRSIGLNTLKEITYTRRSDNTGTLEFDRPGYWTIQGRYDAARGTAMPFMEPHLTPAFEMISDARKIRDLILKARDSAQASATTQAAPS